MFIKQNTPRLSLVVWMIILGHMLFAFCWMVLLWLSGHTLMGKPQPLQSRWEAFRESHQDFLRQPVALSITGGEHGSEKQR